MLVSFVTFVCFKHSSTTPYFLFLKLITEYVYFSLHGASRCKAVSISDVLNRLEFDYKAKQLENSFI